MPKFKYKAKKITGEEMEGEREAEDRFELARDLRKEGFILLFSQEEKKSNKKFFLISILSIFWQVSTAEKMIFCRNLSVMLSAGLPISRALSALSRQTKSKKFKKVIADIEADIQKGEPLNMAMNRHPEVFPAFFSAMVRSGEKTGKLPEALNLIGQQLERDLILTRRVRSAMVYPAIIVVAMVGIGILMMIYVVPTLLSVFEELQVELPLATKIIIFISNAFVKNTFWLILIGIVFVIAVFWALRSKKGQRLLDTALLHAPFLSSLVKKINSSRATRTLSSLISAGVDVTEAFDITENVLQNHYYKEILEKSKKEIQKGSPIAQVFISAEKLFLPLVGEMISVGEETGQLPAMLLQLAVFYEEEVAEATKNLSTVIEPILMIFIGAVVGFFAIAMIQPMYSMMGGL